MHRLDEAILLALAQWRRPWLNRMMMDVSALGSPTIIALITVAAFTVLWIRRDRGSATRIAAAAGGAEIWLEIIKRVIQRPRPMIVSWLTEFSGFSFPSGHTLVATATYCTLASIARTYARTRAERIAIRSICCSIVAMVAISRVYLGVHYPSDIAGGILLGIGWFYFIRYLWRIAQ
jgi:undecaprenyl-diphosphatase